MKKIMTLGILASSFACADQPSEVTSILQAPAVAESDCKQKEVEQIEAIPVKASYKYVNFGVGTLPFPAPVLGLGVRGQRGHHGFDASVQISSIGISTTIKENIDYLYYFKPNLASQYYLGGGFGFSQYVILIEGGKQEMLLSPQIVFGKQYTTKAGGVRYFQMQIDPVFTSLTRSYSGAYPAIVLSYGICF